LEERASEGKKKNWGGGGGGGGTAPGIRRENVAPLEKKGDRILGCFTLHEATEVRWREKARRLPHVLYLQSKGGGEEVGKSPLKGVNPARKKYKVIRHIKKRGKGKNKIESPNQPLRGVQKKDKLTKRTTFGNRLKHD